MSDIGKTALKTKIDNKVYENSSQAITGTIMNEILQDVVDTLADGGNLDAGSVNTANIADGAVTDAKLQNPVSVSQNISTGKEELSIGGNVKWILDNEPEAGSDNLVKSGGVAEDSNLIHSILSKNVLYTLEAGEYKEDGDAADNYYRVRTKNSIPASSWTLEVNSGYLIHRICYYNQDGTFIKRVNGNTQYGGLKFINTENLIARITFRNSAATHLEPTENIISSFKFDYNVNDEVSALKTNLDVATADINNISNEIYGGSININSITFTRGGINSSTGVPQPDVNFARANTDQYFDKRKHTIVCDSTLYKILRVYRYNDTNGDFVDAENINVTTYVNNGEYYSKYEFIRLDGNNFADAHPTGLLTSFTYNLGIKGQLNGLSFWKGTQAEYDDLSTYDNNTVYFIY